MQDGLRDTIIQLSTKKNDNRAAKPDSKVLTQASKCSKETIKQPSNIVSNIRNFNITSEAKTLPRCIVAITVTKAYLKLKGESINVFLIATLRRH